MPEERSDEWHDLRKVLTKIPSVLYKSQIRGLPFEMDERAFINYLIGQPMRV